MKISYLVITLTSSFCTMAYSMILAALTTDFTGDEIRAQCTVMGPYLLGLGMGSLLSDYWKSSGRKVILRLEWLSVLFLPLIPLLIYGFLFFYQHFSPIGVGLDHPTSILSILLVAAFFSFITGVLGGAQLPLILKERCGLPDEVILAVNYAGPLLAGGFNVICLMTATPFPLQVLSVGLVQILGLILLIFSEPRRTKRLALLFFPLILLFISVKNYEYLETLTVKSAYFGMKSSLHDLREPRVTLNVIEKFGTFERHRTPYQTIDLLVEPPQVEYGVPGNASVFLNRKPQFDLFSLAVYHESMVFGGVNLLGRTPERVLILGGGDGILLKELRRIPGISEIKMIELDQGMLDWSGSNNIMVSMNGGVLTETPSNVELVVDDAINFLRKYEGKPFDLILVDFPFPHGQDLLKLYSLEFYKLLRKASSPDSIFVIDMPIFREEESDELSLITRIILKTMKEAGLGGQLLFGPHASFVAVSPLGVPRFDFEAFPGEIDLTTALNFMQIYDLKKAPKLIWDNTPVNTMFWPRNK